MGMIRFFRHGGLIAWGLIGAFVLVAVASTVVFGRTVDARYERDVSRMVFNDNLGLLEEVRHQVGAESDSLKQVLGTSAELPAKDKPYIVVSIEDHRLWYKQGDSVLFTTQVATGSGKVLENAGEGAQWKFETPRGRLVVQSKDSAPAWIPPDWHFVEMAQKKGLGVVKMNRGDQLTASDGSVIAVQGNDLVRRAPNGQVTALEAKEGHELVVNGNIVVPPYGTNARKYMGVLGTHRLNIGDGYALHGTDHPESIGHSVSHGCVRLRNADIDKLYDMVSVGTPVYIY